MARRVTFQWKGNRKPNQAELRSLGRAASRLPPGTYDARPGRRVNTTRARHAYREFHWGNRPTRSKRVKLPSYDEGLFELGALRAVEYETNKGGENAIWVHKFNRPYPKLTGTPRGKLGPIVGGGTFISRAGIER